MSLRCDSCQFENPAGFRFCGRCGTLLSEPVKTMSLDGERRHLTVMFCDLVGSTALSETLDPEDFRETVNTYLEAAGEVAHRFHGYIGNYLGDGLLVYFGYPTSREDAPVLAVRAGLAMQVAMEGLNRVRFSDGLDPLRLRIGIHTGLLVVGELGFVERRESSMVMGRTPNLAARLQSLARPGSVVMSLDTWRLVRPHFHGELLGEFDLHGIAEPVVVYEVSSEQDATNRQKVSEHGVAMVGREMEMEAVLSAWARAKAGDFLKLLVSGEAGIGKSRLVRDVEQIVEDDGGCFLALHGRSQAQGSAFQPVIDLLREVLGFEKVDTPEDQADRMTRFAAEHGFDESETVEFLGQLLGVAHTAHGRVPLTALRARLFEFVPELIRRLAARRPVALVVEDLHWLDPSTVEALQRLVQAGSIPRVFLLCTSRPEFPAGWLESQRIDLTRLSASRALLLVDQLVLGKDLPVEVTQQIVKKAGGVPLFIEEMTRNVVDSGMLVEHEEHYELAGEARTMAIPDSLHALLMARLDRLNSGRETAQVAAVLGQEFHIEMLRELRGEDGTLDTQIMQLVKAGIIAPADEDVDDGHFVFRHALIHAEAYDSLLKRKRRDYHRQIAALLTSRHADTMQPEIVAHHYTEAGVNDEAARFWLRAAVCSADRAAGSEALEQTNRGILLLDSITEATERRTLEMDLMSVRGRAATMIKGYGAPEVAASFARVSELCREIHDVPRRAEALSAIFAYHIARANYPAALKAAEEMEHLGAREMAWLSHGTHAYYTGQLERCVDCMTRGIKAYEAFDGPRPMRGLDAKVACLAWAGMAQLMLGKPDLSRRMMREAIAWARELKFPHTEAFARLVKQSHDFWLDDPEAALDGMEEHLAICREQAFTYFLTLSLLIDGWARFRLDGEARHVETIERCLHGWQRTGALLAAAQHSSALIETRIQLGQLEAAAAQLVRARVQAKSSEERVYEPLLSCLEAELALKATPPDESHAETCYRESLAQAREIKACWHELRPSHGLATLLQKQGRLEEARHEISTVVSLFGPEQNAPLLTKARSLLAQLP